MMDGLIANAFSAISITMICMMRRDIESKNLSYSRLFDILSIFVV